jgi:hypothetical protein
LNARDRIVFQAEEINLKRLPEFSVTLEENENAIDQVLQLCLCKNGRLYATSISCFNNSNQCLDL